MWNSLPIPFVCEIHTIKRCLYYNHLPHNPISAARRQKKYYKKEALALTESKQSRSLCWWLWQVHSLAEEWGEDQNLASSCKNCCRSDFFRPLLARLVESSVQTHIFITKAKTTVSPGPWVWLNLSWLPCPLFSSQDWTETFDDDQSNYHKTSDRARQKTSLKCILWCIKFGLCIHQTYSFKQMTYWSAGGLGMFDVARRCSQIIEFFSDYLFT